MSIPAAPAACAVSIAGAGADGLLSPPARACANRGRTAMAKGQKRSNREPKKPKADKKKVPATAGIGAGAPAKSKGGAASSGSKK